MKRQVFSNSKKTVAAYDIAITDLSDTDWKKCFQTGFIRIELFIENEEKYFEKLQNK